MTNAKDNRNSQVFESLVMLDQPQGPAVSDKERKKFEDEKSKLYAQLDEKVSIRYDCFAGCLFSALICLGQLPRVAPSGSSPG